MCRKAIIQRGESDEVNILWLHCSFLTPPAVWQIIITLQGVMPMPNLPKIVLITPDPRQIAATQLVKPFEGFSAEPYRDPGGVWSIGYGSTVDAWGNTVTADTAPVTQAQALALVERDLTSALEQVNAVVVVPLGANQQAALIDFVYNVGAGNFERSTLLALLNQGDYAGAGAQFTRWDYADGVLLPGLLRRREAEAALFGAPDPATAWLEPEAAQIPPPAPDASGIDMLPGPMG